MNKSYSRDMLPQEEKSQNFCSSLGSISYELIKYWGSWLNERASIKITVSISILFQ